MALVLRNEYNSIQDGILVVLVNVTLGDVVVADRHDVDKRRFCRRRRRRHRRRRRRRPNQMSTNKRRGLATRSKKVNCVKFVTSFLF